MKHFILFDPTCNLCKNSVNWILNRDHKQRFLFAPLKGKTAQKLLGHQFEKYKDLNTLIFIETSSKEKKIWIRGKAVFRILWVLGGCFAWIGFFHFVPGCDFGYRWIARHRHRLNFVTDASKIKKIPKERLLP